MPLRADNAQAAERDNLLLFRFDLGLKIVHVLIVQLARTLNLLGLRGENGRGKVDILFLEPFLFELFLSHKLGVAAQHNVSTAARHVGGYRHLMQPPRLRYNHSLFLVVFGVEHVVRDLATAQNLAQLLALFHVGRADEHGLSAVVAFFNVLDHRAQLARRRGKQQIVLVHALGRNVGRNGDDV